MRYVTLTHTCHNVFADSSGLFDGIKPLHYGLRYASLSSSEQNATRLCIRASLFGETLVKELNRLGVLVDLSHTSDHTALAALSLSRAPVIWSHSSARTLRDIPRNVPDEVLRHVGTGEGQRDGVVMVRTRAHTACATTDIWTQVNFYSAFVSADPDSADVKVVADHVDHIASVTGRAQYVFHSSLPPYFAQPPSPRKKEITITDVLAGSVGIGSDYDGIERCPIGLEDVSTYPVLVRSFSLLNSFSTTTASRSDTRIFVDRGIVQPRMVRGRTARLCLGQLPSCVRGGGGGGA